MFRVGFWCVAWIHNRKEGSKNYSGLQGDLTWSFGALAPPCPSPGLLPLHPCKCLCFSLHTGFLCLLMTSHPPGGFILLNSDSAEFFSSSSCHHLTNSLLCVPVPHSLDRESDPAWFWCSWVQVITALLVLSAEAAGYGAGRGKVMCCKQGAMGWARSLLSCSLWTGQLLLHLR